MIDLAHCVALALESVYDPQRKYGFSFWYRSAETGGATQTMMIEAFRWLSDHPDQWKHHWN